MKQRSLSALAFISVWSLAPSQAESQPFADDDLNDLSRFVVEVASTKQTPDFDNPWQRERAETSRYLGTVVEGGRILLTADAVVDATHLAMTKLGSSERQLLQVYAVDYEANLALLRPQLPGTLDGLSPAELDVEVGPGTSVSLVNIGKLGRPATFTARISKADVRTAETSAYRLPSYAIDIKGTGFGRSEPAFYDEHLAAIVTGASSGFVRAVPAAVIRHFLIDVQSGRYRGFPDLGLVTSVLDSPVRRKSLGAPNTGGVRVVHTMGQSNGSIESDDVLLRVANREIDSEGRIEHPVWGKVSFQAVLIDFFGGDTIRVQIARRGKLLDLDVPVQRFDSSRLLVPPSRQNQREPHLIVGGMVLQELTRPFLETWGRDWTEDAPIAFVHADQLINRTQTVPDERIIIVNRVLADTINLGYERITYRLIERVNGIEIHSLRDVEKALCDHPLVRKGRLFAQLSFQGSQGEAIFAYDELASANHRIAGTYHIPASGSFFEPRCATTQLPI